MRQLPSYRRSEMLERIAAGIVARADIFASMMTAEMGKPITASRIEVNRAVETFKLAAAEAVRPEGQWLGLDSNERNAGLQAIVRRFPVGPCSLITPFNFPLNLAAHKIAPAIACGCPFVLKPAPQTPLTALMLGELLAEADLPHGSWSILPCSNEIAAPLVEDDRMRLLSFTGSAAVGWMLRSRAGRKRVVLELGGNAACIVDKGAEVEHAASRIVTAAFSQSGQSCISVQRVYAHESLYDDLRQRLIDGAKALKTGDPRDESVTIGPLITEADARRIEAWINEAVGSGAKLLCGGTRDGAFVEPAIVEDVRVDAKLTYEEAFGPVLTLERFEDFADACARVDCSRFGLQAGVFTPSLEHAMQAYETIEVGAVVINDVPTIRADAMPYGGVKDSGLGREGVRWAMQEMTEPRVMLMRRT